ncbi:MAG: tail fiber domain-containing protein [Xanthobacteraceae bacterium]|nr:tail fiber domain-containing protein [Xanthobacteraceae bacterium]
MPSRFALLSSTFLSTWLGGAVMAAEAPPSSRAVDTVNATFEALGGSYATNGLYGGAGKLALPLGDQFGLQLDGAAGTFGNRFIGSGAAHLFWRNPQQGLIGIYARHLRWSEHGGVNVSHLGGEGEVYLGRFTLRAVAGVEWGNNSSVLSGSTTSRTFAAGFGTATQTTSSTAAQLDRVTRFFDRVTLAYYVTDNWKASVGHRYFGGRHMLALGSEYAQPLGRGVMASLFGEGRWGEGSHNYGAWGGVRFYFGTSDKSLIRRHREDDPGSDTAVDTLFSIANSLGPGSTSSNTVCNDPGEIFNSASCVPLVSDIRLKHDVVLLARLESGIGLYRFRYIFSDIVHVGVMAQEVARIAPDAVHLAADGYYRVDYARLGLRMMTFEEWAGQKADALAA